MNLLIPSSKISHQKHPCPNCNASTPVDVITDIASEEDLSHFCVRHLNRAQCTSCGALVEAPARVTLTLDCEGVPKHECIPLALL